MWDVPDRLRTLSSNSAARMLLLVGGFYVLQAIIMRSVAVSEDLFRQPVLLFAWLSSFKGCLVGSAFLLFVWSLRGVSWSSFGGSEDSSSKALRTFVALCALLAVWPLAVSSYNYYFDQMYLLDRILLLSSWLVLLSRPAGVFPVILLSALFNKQYALPIGGESWAMLGFPLKLLMMFAVFLMLRRVLSIPDERELWAALLVVVSAHYWGPGFAKFRMGWVLHDQVAFILPSTCGNSWLAVWSGETIGRLTRILESGNWFIKLFTISLEMGAVFALLGRRPLAVLAAAWVAFHLGICSLTGIFLWPWLSVDLALLWLALKRPALWTFPRSVAITSVLLVLFSPLWSGVAKLSWFDARASYTYHFQGVGEDGREYPIPPRRFAPYAYQFTLCGFGYLVEEPGLPITWGACGFELSQLLKERSSVKELLELEKARGVSRFQEEGKERFVGLLRAFMENSKSAPLTLAPPYLLTYSPESAYEAQPGLQEIKVYQVFSAYDGTDYVEIRRRLVLSVQRLGEGVSDPATD